MTQLGRALAELTIEIICANSSQAKGRVERVNRTLQDRLVKELRLAGVCSMEDGNAFLPEFLQRFNERFAVSEIKPENMHRALNVDVGRLGDMALIANVAQFVKPLVELALVSTPMKTRTEVPTWFEHTSFNLPLNLPPFSGGRFDALAQCAGQR